MSLDVFDGYECDGQMNIAEWIEDLQGMTKFTDKENMMTRTELEEYRKLLVEIEMYEKNSKAA